MSDPKVTCETNKLRTQVRFTVATQGEEVVVEGVRLVQPTPSGIYKEILTHVLEDGNYDFKNTEVASKAKLKVILQLGKRDGDAKGPTVGPYGPRAEITTIDPSVHKVQATVGGSTEVYDLAAVEQGSWAADTTGLYLELHPPVAVEETPGLLSKFWAKLQDAGMTAVAGAVVAGVVLVGGLIAVWLGAKGNDPVSTSQVFWSPPAVTDAEWTAATSAGCEATPALGGAAYRCVKTDAGGKPQTGTGASLVPCFAVEAGRFLCAEDPWHDDEVVPVAVPVDPGGPDPDDGAISVPTGVELKAANVWSLELEDGRRCVVDFEHGGRRFRCAANGKVIGEDATTSLGGIAAPEKGPWTIVVRTSGSSASPVDISKVWGVYVDNP